MGAVVGVITEALNGRYASEFGFRFQQGIHCLAWLERSDVKPGNTNQCQTKRAGATACIQNGHVARERNAAFQVSNACVVIRSGHPSNPCIIYRRPLGVIGREIAFSRFLLSTTKSHGIFEPGNVCRNGARTDDFGFRCRVNECSGSRLCSAA